LDRLKIAVAIYDFMVLVYCHVTGHADRVFTRVIIMSSETNKIDGAFMDSFEAYANDSKAVSELKTRLENARLVLEPVIRQHKIPVGDNKAWKEKRALFYPIVKELGWPRGDDDIPGEEDKVEAKRAEARIAAWLGVIRTCLEYQILPTDRNADRLRKARTWTALNGNGKVNPNWVDPKAPTPSLTEAEAEKIVDKQIEAIDKKETKKAAASLNQVENALDLATMTTPPATKLEAFQKAVDSIIPPESVTDKPIAASTKPTTSQKAQVKGDIPRPNVSSSDEPLSPREHCAILLDQLFKNDAFRGEFAPILATMLDSNVGIVTRCLVESRDLFCKGGK
jgi:hypothetical protein